MIKYQSERRASGIGVKLLVFFTFFIDFFMKTLIKSIIYCQAVPLEHLLLMYVVLIVYRAPLLSFPTRVSWQYFVLDQWLMEIFCSVQRQLSLVGDNSLVHMNLE